MDSAIAACLRGWSGARRSRPGGGGRTWSSWRRRRQSPVPPAGWCRRRQRRLCLRARAAAEARRSACARGWPQCLHGRSQRAAACAHERCAALACQTGAAASAARHSHARPALPRAPRANITSKALALSSSLMVYEIVVRSCAWPAARALPSAQLQRNSSAALNTSALNTCKDIVRPKLVQDARRRCHSGS